MNKSDTRLDFNRWELTLGRKVDYHRHLHWYVMVWVSSNDGTTRASFGPLSVRNFDGSNSITIRLPEYAHRLFGDPDTTIGDSRGAASIEWYKIGHQHIWARRPFVMPDEPNVSMIFENNPWEKNGVE